MKKFAAAKAKRDAKPKVPIEKRKLIYRHNAFHGSAKMTTSMMESIIHSSTATILAKELATKIWSDSIELKKALKERVGP